METVSHKTGITALASEQAPFVYFDGVVGLGTNHGAVQLELAARTVVPNGEGGVESKIVVTCHIRCSLHAAASLRDAIDKVLSLAKRTPGKDDPKWFAHTLN